MNLTSKSFLSAILIVSCIVLGYFFLLPRWDTYTAANAGLDSAKSTQENLYSAKAQLTSFLREYRDHIEDAKRLNQALPLSQSEMHNILNNLDTLTRSSGLALGQLSIKETPESDQLGASANAIHPIDLSINGSGPYLAFKNFLVGLESNLRLMDIEDLTLSAGEEGDVAFSMSFRTYYQK